MYRPSELRPFLESLSAKAKKSLSQNFLIDGNIIRKIVSSSQITAGATVLEIGPGPGALTGELLAAGAHVVAVEKDAAFAKSLHRLQTIDKRLQIIECDILHMDLAQYAPIYHVVANLPYHLTSPILAKLLKHAPSFSSITVMLQQEVAKRIAAKPGSKIYGHLSVFCQFYAAVDYLFPVSKKCFFPAPKVTSAVVQFLPRALGQAKQDVFELSRMAFQERRKMLRSSLKKRWQPSFVEQALIQLHLDPHSRPEELSVQNFIDLFHLLSQTV